MAASAAGLGAGGGVGVGAEGGKVMIHWTQSGPSVQPVLGERSGGPRSPDEDEDLDEDDDELLAPAPPRERLSYTRYQLELLNGIFLAVRYPNSVQKQLIAKRVGISREQVKIWFQNRRRKDVVLSKTSTTADTDNSNSSPQDSASLTTSSPNTNSSCSTNGAPPCDNESNPDTDKNTDDQSDNAKSRMVPEAVVNGCITELKRFSDEKLKERKEKRKAKGKRRAHTTSVPSSGSAHSSLQAGAPKSAQPGSRLFQAYDMVAPPNKVTPNAAFLDTSTNRFNHSHNSSAFSSPRDQLTVASSMPRMAWDGLDAGAYGGLGAAAGLGMGLMPTSQSQAVGMGMAAPQDSLPVLSDLLTAFRQQVDTGSSSVRDNREAFLPQASVLSASSPGSRDAAKRLELGSFSSGGLPAPPSPFSVNRVYPFPFIADPPIMLSSLPQHDPLQPHNPWPYHAPPPAPHPPPPPPPHSLSHFNSVAAMNGMDPFKSVRISSLSNPYFSNTPPPPPPHLPHWSHPSGHDPTSLGTSFTQL